MPDLLIELFSEEIPARMQARAREDLKKLVTDGLVEAGLTYGGAAAFSTPRRLTLAIEGLAGESAAVREERKGPATTAPEAAIEGFLRSTGLSRDQLEVRDDKKGQVFFAVMTKPGRAAPAIIAEVLEGAIRNFPWPKSMRWGSGSLRWVRPLHSILCLLTSEAGAEVVEMEVDGIRAGNQTRGHRFLSKGAITVTSFDDYAAKLKRAHVVLDSAEREAHIWADATNAAFAAGLEVVEDRGLLAEVAGLVEWPVVLMGRIGEDFLSLPPEVLQTSMKEHQKFFSVRNPKTGRIEGFVTVANTETKDQGATILKGNQKVLSARLSDAKFFWENDLRTVRTSGMEGMAAGLAHVTFHNKLGSQKDRIDRITALAREIAPLVGAAPDLAAEAARVVKADLQSAMVGEFPELQGTMGTYYARAEGLPEAVALACKAHYQPLGPSDAVPSEPVSVAVALADKIDTLTGFWAIDEKPTGSKDPFALRRAALGLIRLVLGNGVRLRLGCVLRPSIHLFKEQFERQLELANYHQELERSVSAQILLEQILRDVAQDDFRRAPMRSDLMDFVLDRLKVVLRESGIRHDIIDAVSSECVKVATSDEIRRLSVLNEKLERMGRPPVPLPSEQPAMMFRSQVSSEADDFTLLVKRAEALAAFLKTDNGANLLQGFKRANNILSAEEKKDGVEYSYGADVKFAETEEERALFAALDQADAAIAPAMKAEEFGAAMAAMAALRAPIDAFFTAVQVNSDNPVVRRNRLNLLSRIRTICLSVADLTKIEG